MDRSPHERGCHSRLPLACTVAFAYPFRVITMPRSPNHVLGVPHVLSVPIVPWLTVVWLVASTAAAPCTLAQESRTYRTHTVQAENDFKITDEQYTNGLRYSQTNLHSGSVPLQKRRSPWLWFADDWLRQTFPTDDLWRWTTGWSLGQNFYTPTAITDTSFIPDDRPYAGWLYLGSSTEWTRVEASVHSAGLELKLGTVGPQSLSGFTQRNWHTLIRAKDPRGWHYQVERLVAVTLRGYYQRGGLPSSFEGWGSDGSFFGGATIGTVFNQASTGFEGRFGYNLTTGFAPDYLRPTVINDLLAESEDNDQDPQGLAGAPAAAPRKFEAYIFLRFGARGVASNYLIQGGDHTIRMKRGVLDANAGVVVRFGRYLFSLQQIVRSPEFAPSKWHRYNSVGLSILQGQMD